MVVWFETRLRGEEEEERGENGNEREPGRALREERRKRGAGPARPHCRTMPGWTR